MTWLQAALAADSGRTDRFVSLIQSRARALAPHKITVTGFAPGIVATPLWGDVAGDDAVGRLDAYTPGIPLGRVSVAADLDGAALFLAGPGSDYITGQVIIVQRKESS